MKLLDKIKAPFQKEGGFKFKFNKKWIKWIVIIAVIVGVVLYVRSNMKKALESMNPGYETAAVEKRDIEMNLSGTGIIEPLNQYSVMPMVQGEVTAAPFEEGQEVKKDDLLYQFSTKDIKNGIKAAKLSVQRAQIAYNDVVKLKDDLVLKSNAQGYVKTLHVKAGDTITMGTPIADVYDNTTMILSVPFNDGDVNYSWIGKRATVEVGDGLERVSGTVTEISPTTEVMAGNMLVRMVKISVKNPGGITTTTTATASIGNVDCNSEGTFEVKEEKTITSTGNGKIASLNIKEGSYVKNKQTYAMLDGENLDSQIRTAKIAVDESKLALENQENALDNYSIKAPISGQIITKNVKEGDTVNASSATSATGGVMAIIYDLSAVTFKMNVDELDVRSIEIGMDVIVTADALEGQEMKGYIETISLDAITNNGVTQYPITIHLDDVGDLLPGMNVEGKIVTQTAYSVYTIPVMALQRGDVVYIKDDTQDEGSNAQALQSIAAGEIPAGFKEVSVEVGINDGNYVEIKSGLSPDDIVYVPAVPSGSSMMDMMMNGGGQVQYAE